MSRQAQHGSELAHLAGMSGDEAGWCDEHGDPAPFPDDFFDPDSDWRPATSNISPMLADGEQPF